MAVVGLSSTGIRKVDLSSDPDKGTDKATKFSIGSISAREMAAIKDEAMQGGKKGNAFELRPNQTSLKVVQRGLKGWENFPDENGNPIEFKTEEIVVGGKKYIVASAESLDRLNFVDILELSEIISGVNRLDEDERKN